MLKNTTGLQYKVSFLMLTEARVIVLCPNYLNRIFPHFGYLCSYNSWSMEANAQAEKQIVAVVHSCQERSKYLQFDNNDNKNIPYHTATPDTRAQLLIVSNICSEREITLVHMLSTLFRSSEVPLNMFCQNHISTIQFYNN